MADVHTPAARRRNMQAIRNRDSKPEIIVRSGLHRRGFRFKLHDKTLPGKPDLVFPKYRAVILVHGCFFHGHECDLFKWPATRQSFWREKILSNRNRDRRQIRELQSMGWRLAVVWECSVKKKDKQHRNRVVKELESWLRGTEDYLSIEQGNVNKTVH